MDLGEIQLINDSFGHAFCDRLIQEAGARLKNILADQYLLVRLAADEFGILVNDINKAMDISGLVFDLKTCLQLPFKLDDESLYMNPSIGIALYPDDAANADDLLRFARIA
ncbi:GGDEF domain-containing protein, partial [Arthrospira platensis SPKY2]